MKVQLHGKRNIFEEIAEQYRTYIQLGVVAEGEKLPSYRELAMSLGINPNTVERAYAILEAEGLVVILPKKGAFAASPRIKQKMQLMEDLAERMKALRKMDVMKEEIEAVCNEVYKEENPHD